MRPAAFALLGLAGCTSPISNARFYEDAAFVQTVPSSAGLAPPIGFDASPRDANDVLADGVLAAVRYRDAIAAIGACGDALRAAPPDTRSDVVRGWDATTVAWSDASGVEVAWMEAEIVRSADIATVTLELGPTADGPFEPFATGWRLADGTAHLDVLDLSIDFVSPADPLARSVGVSRSDGVVATESWAIEGESFGWSGAFELTADASAWPGWAVAAHGPSGGRATGQVLREAEALAFEACWRADGTSAYVGGDPGIQTLGTESACDGG